MAASLHMVEPVGNGFAGGKGRRGGNRSGSKTSIERTGRTNEFASNDPDDPDEDNQWMPDHDERDERGEFATRAQFLLTVIGFTMGNGNFWHFPMVVRANGGAAFLIMYFISMAFFGVPMLYLEMMIGQIAQVGPMRAFQLNFPLLQGVGWAVCSLSFLRAVNIALLNSYSLDYAVESLIGVSARTNCESAWNTLACFSPHTNMKKCHNESLAWYNNSCITIEERLSRLPLIELPAREDYRHTLRGLKAGFDESEKKGEDVTFLFESSRVVLCFCLVWIFACFCLVRRVRWLGKLALFIVTFAGVLTTIFLLFSLTLERVDIALQKYFHIRQEPFLNWKTWILAIRYTQTSLCLGIGGIISLSSYNKRSNDAFWDSVIVVAVSALVSVMSSISIFIIISVTKHEYPFLNWQRQEQDFDYVLLYFVYYPITFSKFEGEMECFFSFFLYTLLFALGISTFFGLLETPISALTDQFKFCRKHRSLTILILCFVAFGLGLGQCTTVGFHIFYAIDARVAPFMAEVMVGFQLLTIALYGPRNFYRDISASIGKKVNLFGYFISPYGLLIRICQFAICPCIIACSLYDRLFGKPDIFQQIMKRKARLFKNGNDKILKSLVWISVLLIPIVIAGLVMAIMKHKRAGKPWIALIRPDPMHPAVRYRVPPPLGWFFGLKPIEAMPSAMGDDKVVEFPEKGKIQESNGPKEEILPEI